MCVCVLNVCVCVCVCVYRERHRERASLLAQMIKNLPAIQEPSVPSLGQEDPL